MLNVVMFSVVFIYRYAECHYDECHYDESRGAIHEVNLTKEVLPSCPFIGRVGLNPLQ
jgi:hypothetical protein